MRLNDITGNRYGRLVVLERVKGKYWLCQCDCGNQSIVNRDHLGKDTNSCGCIKREVTRARATTHGYSHTRLYNLWQCVKIRCYNPNSIEHSSYYDRGIGMCDEWKDDFVKFREWMLANGYDETAPRGQYTIDRIDNDKGYSPENCRVVTQLENARNKRNTRRFVVDGNEYCIGELSEMYGNSPQLIRRRIQRGWNAYDAATKPVKILKGVNDGSRNRNV